MKTIILGLFITSVMTTSWAVEEIEDSSNTSVRTFIASIFWDDGDDPANTKDYCIIQ